MTDEAALNIRHMDRSARERLSRGARARGMTLAQYVQALVDLHDAMRALADTEHRDSLHVLAELRRLGLESVTN